MSTPKIWDSVAEEWVPITDGQSSVPAAPQGTIGAGQAMVYESPGVWRPESVARQQDLEDLRDEVEGHHHDERYHQTAATFINVKGPDTGGEGGQIQLEGAGSHTDWNVDSYGDSMRFMQSGYGVILTLVTPNNASNGGSGFQPLVSWTDVTFVNGYSQYAAPYGPTRYMKDAMGTVFVRGLGQCPASPNVTAFTLPSGCRPGVEIITACASSSSSGESEIRISPTTGTVTVQAYGPASGWQSFEMCFKAEG